MNNFEVIQVINTTKEILNDHWLRTVSSRLSDGGMGSRYPQHQKVETLEKALEKGDWKPYEDSNGAISENAFGVIANIPGETGMIQLDNLDADDEVQLVDPKKTGFLSAVVRAGNYEPTNFTVMIIGEHNGENVVFTFYPGDPVEPSSISGEERTVTVREAQKLGFDLAKIEISD